MNFIRQLIFIVALTTGLPVTAAEISLAKITPKGRANAAVLKMAIDTKTEEIVERMNKSIGQHSTWFKTFISQHKEWKPSDFVPYHPNLGITAEEYKYMVNNLKRSAHAVEIGKVLLTSLPTKTGAQLSVDTPDSTFHDIDISFDSKTVETPLGTLKRPKFISSDQVSPPLGKWTGYSWSLQEGDPLAGKGEAKGIWLSMGLVLASKKKFIHYKAVLFKDGRPVIKEELNLLTEDGPVTAP
jgi:hypothetical protein